MLTKLDKGDSGFLHNFEHGMLLKAESEDVEEARQVMKEMKYLTASSDQIHGTLLNLLAGSILFHGNRCSERTAS